MPNIDPGPPILELRIDISPPIETFCGGGTVPFLGKEGKSSSFKSSCNADPSLPPFMP